MRNQRLFWALPALNGGFIALTLWAMNDYDITRVAGEWVFILLSVGVYLWVVHSIPVDWPTQRRRQGAVRGRNALRSLWHALEKRSPKVKRLH